MTILTIAQAEASSATSGLIVADTAANIATGLAAFPNLATKVASFSLSAASTVSAAQAQKLAGLGTKFHLASYGLTVSDSLANLAAPADAAGVALATSLAVVDVAYLLLAAPLSRFANISTVTLTGSPTLDIAQINHLLLLPHFTISSAAVVTLSDAASVISAAISTNPSWFHSVHAIAMRLDTTGVSPYAATLLAAAISAGKSVTFVTSTPGTPLIINGPAQSIGTDAASLAILAAHVTLSYTLTSTTVTAAVAAGLAGLTSFANQISSVTVSDTAANIAAHPGNVFGPAFHAVVVTSGNLNTTAANLLASNLQLQDATATLSASATLTAAQAITLTALHGFALGTGVTLTVQDTLVHLEALSSLAIIDVTTTKLIAGTVLSLNVAQANTLSAVSGFTNAGATITVTDSIADLQDNGGWSSVATAYDVVDTAANILTSIALPLVTSAAAVTLSANATVTAAQAVTLHGLTNFSHGVFTLIVADTAANVTSNLAAIEAVASIIDITGTSTVTAAAAETLATLPTTVLLANGSQLVISDSYANITASANAAGTALASGLTIDDTAANLITAAAHGWGSITPSYVLSQSGTVTAAQLTTLGGLGAAFTAGAYTLTLADTVAHVTALTALIRNAAGAIVVTDIAANITTGVLTTFEAYSVLPSILISDNANHVSVSTATYSADTSLIDNIGYVTAPTTRNPGAVTVTGSAAQINTIASAIAADAHVGAVAITDTVADLTLSVLNTLQAAYNATPPVGTFDKGLSILLSDPLDTLSVTAAEYGNDAATIDDVSNLSLLTVTGTAAAIAGIATALAGDSKVHSIAVTDSVNNISAAASSLAALDTKLAITLTASGVVTAAGLSAIVGAASLTSNGFTMSLADTVANVTELTTTQLAYATSIAITDTSGSLTAGALTMLAADEVALTNENLAPTPLTITFSDTGLATFTAANYTTYAAIIDDITNVGQVAITGTASAIAGIAATLAADTKVGSVAVTDTAANINTNLASLSTLGSKLSSITLNGGGAVSVATAALFGSGVSFTRGAFTYTIADTVAHVVAATSAELTAASGIAITDTAANLTTGALNTLTSDQSTLGTGHTLTITLSNAANITVTAATYLADSATIDDITNSTHPVIVTGTAAAVAPIATALANDTRVGSVVITDSAANISAAAASLALTALEAKLTITLNAGGAVSAATLALLNAAATYNSGGNTLSLADTVANVVALLPAGPSNVTAIAITDVAANLTTTALGLLTTYVASLGAVPLTIAITGGGTVGVTATTYSEDATAIDDITTAGAVAVTGTAAAILAIATTLKNDAAVGSIVVSDSSATVVADLPQLLAVGSKLSVTLTDTLPITAASVPQLVQLSINNPSAITVADTGSNLASVIESASAATLTFLQGAVVQLSGDSQVAAADAAALLGLSSFSLGGHVLKVYDTYSHLTASGYAAALANAKVSGVYLNTGGSPVTLTAANMLALLALPKFHATTPLGASDSITVSDTAAHFAADFTTLQANSATLTGVSLMVNTSAIVTDAVLAELQTLGAASAGGVSLTVRDTAATIAANELVQSSFSETIVPTAWALSASASITLAQAETLGTTTGFTAGSYKLTVSQPTSTVITVQQANALGTLGSALVITGGGQLDVQGTVAQLSLLSANALSIVTPQITDTFANVAGLTSASSLLGGTITISDSEPVNATLASSFFNIIKVGAGAGIPAANVSFGSHVENVTDTYANLLSLTGIAAYSANPTLASAFTLGAADTVANLINPAHLSFLETLSSSTLSANSTTMAASAETLFLIENEIHFSKGTDTLTISDTPTNLLNANYSDGFALANTIHLSADGSTTAAGAETLLGESNFALTHVLTIEDTAANLLDGTLGAALATGGYPVGGSVVVELSGSTIVDATTATELADLPGFADPNHYLTITDDPAYLIASTAYTAENIAATVTIPSDEIVSAATVLKLSAVPNFTPGAYHLDLAGNDVADAATLGVIGTFGTSFNHETYSITMTADDISLTPAQYNSLQSDDIVTNGHLFGAVAAIQAVSYAENNPGPTAVLTLSTPYAANGSYHLYDSTGTAVASTNATTGAATETVTYTDTANNFSLTETIGNGTASAPAVLLDTATITSAMTQQTGSYANAPGANEVAIGGGNYLPLYTTATLLGYNATSALVYDPTAHTLSLETPNEAPAVLITLGGSSFPTALTTSEITVKTHS